MTHIARQISGCALMAGIFFTVQPLAQDAEWELSGSDTGVGTGSPSAKLHVVGDGVGNIAPFDTERVLRLESSLAPEQIFVNSTSGAIWYFAMVSNDDFKVSFDGTGKVEARFKPDGTLRIAGSLIQNSDRHSKINVREIDGREVLEKLASLPISTWEYKSTVGVTHLGPMAQDFYTAFGIGESPTGISSIDTGGVALAAIQGLYAQLEDKAVQLSRVKAENVALQAMLKQHEERMQQLELAVAALGQSQRLQTDPL